MADGPCCVNFVRWLVIIFNFIFALCGLLLVGIGTWMLVDENIDKILNVTEDASNSHLLRIAGIMLIAVGSLLFIISLMGVIGAIIENKIVLGIFIGCLVVIFLGEIIGGVLAIVFKDSLLEDLDVTLRDSLKNYYENVTTCQRSDTGIQWDEVQKLLECCGIGTSGSGYENFDHDTCTSTCSARLPLSCYKEQTSSTTACIQWEKGCLQEVEDRITYYAPILIGIGLGIAMIQTIGIILATCLCVNAPSKPAGYKRHHRD